MSAVLLAQIGSVKRQINNYVRQDEAQRAFVFTLGVDSGALLQDWLQDAKNLSAFQAMCDARGMMSDVTTTSVTMDAVVASQVAMDAVVASQVAMEAVIASQTAMDAVVASQVAMEAVAASQVAMTSIYANAYAASAFVASPHAQIGVPAMTSATAPSGTATSQADYSGYEAWKAFDKSNSTRWKSNASDSWIAYEFSQPMLIHTALIINNAEPSGNYIEKCTVQFYDDSVGQWVNATDEITVPTTTATHELPVREIQKHSEWRFSINNATNWCGAFELDFVGIA